VLVATLIEKDDTSIKWLLSWESPGVFPPEQKMQEMLSAIMDKEKKGKNVMLDIRPRDETSRTVRLPRAVGQSEINKFAEAVTAWSFKQGIAA